MPAAPPVPPPAAPDAGGPAAVAAALFCFSAGPVGIAVQKLLVASFSPFLIVAVQMTLGAAALWLVRLALPAARPARAWALGLGLGALHPGAFMIVYTAASARLDSITAVLLIAPVPALVAVLGWVVLREVLRPVVMAGILVSAAGLVLLAGERQATGENEPLGFLLAALGLLLAASGVVAGRALSLGAALPWHLLAPLQVTGAALAAWAGVVALGVAVEPADLAAAWLPFAYLGLGMTAASYAAYTFALSRLPAQRVALVAAAGPGVGAVAAALIFAAPIGAVAALGIGVILLGAALPPLWTLLAAGRRPAIPPTAPR